MKSGSTLQDIAQRLSDQRNASVDLLVKEPAIAMSLDGSIGVPETPAPDRSDTACTSPDRYAPGHTCAVL